MTKSGPTKSPWHRGEQILQEREGVAERMTELGARIVRDFMPEQHRVFFAQLSFLVLGAVDAEGSPWASLVEGTAGFVSSPDERTLRVDALPEPTDPLAPLLVPGAALGALGIELPTRRRNRANGAISARDNDGFTLHVQQSFGNCPQYIQTRAPSSAAGDARQRDVQDLGASLDGAARAQIGAADTFFVASYADEPARAVDVSHRGGKPGFVRIDGDVLTVPDFSGNLHFNTLGNLLLNPRAGLCFVDFERGDLLQLSGSTELVFDGAELASFDGAERLWRCRVQRAVRRTGALSLRMRFSGYSPFSLRTGAWSR
jgi:predicted pyridoxine 5'-phosphate oxidase superfamily flavin-nucleotide-binding protein